MPWVKNKFGATVWVVDANDTSDPNVVAPKKKKSSGGGGTNQWGGPKGTKKDAAGNSYGSKAHARFGGSGGSSTSSTGAGAGTSASQRASENQAFLRARKREIARRRAAAERRMRKQVERAAKRRAAKVAKQEAKRAAAQAALDAANERVKAAKNVAEAKAAVAQQRIAQQKLAEATASKKDAEREARRAAATAVLESQARNQKAQQESDKKPGEPRFTRAQRLRNRAKRRQRIAETKNKPPLLPKSDKQRGEAGYGKRLRTRMRKEIALQKQHPELFDQNVLDDLGNELILHQQLMRDQWRERTQALRQTGKAIKEDLKAGNTKAARRKLKKYEDLADKKELRQIEQEFATLFGREAAFPSGKFNKKKFRLSLTEEFALGANEVWDAHVAHVEEKVFGTGLVGFANRAAYGIEFIAKKAIITKAAAESLQTIYDPVSGKSRKQTVSERMAQMARTGELDRFGQTEAGAEATANFQERALTNKNDPELSFLYDRLIKANIETNADVSNDPAKRTLVMRQIVPEATKEAFEEFQNSDRYVVPGSQVGLFDPENYGRDEQGEYFIDPDGNKLRHGDEIQGGFVPHWGTGNDLIGDFFGLTGPPRQQELDRHFNSAKNKYDKTERQRIEDKLWAEVGQADPGFIGDAMRIPIAGEVVTGLDAAFGLTSHEIRKQTLTEYGASLDELDPRLAGHLSRAAADDPRKDNPDFPGQDLLQEFLGIPIRTLENVTTVIDEETGQTGIPKILFNMADATGKVMTFPANMIVFPIAETVGKAAKGEDIIKTYADKDEEGLVTASLAIAGWAGIGSTMSKEVGEDGEATRYDVTFEVAGVPFSLYWTKGEAVEKRLEDESKAIKEAWGTGDWGVFFEVVGTEGEFFKNGNLAGALNMALYLLFDPTNYIAPLTIAKRGLGGVRAAAAAGQNVDSRLLSLAQKAKAFGEGFGTNPNHAEALGGALEDWAAVSGMNPEDALESLQRVLLEMDEGMDPVPAMQKVFDELGLSRDVVDVKQLHAWAEEHIRAVMKNKWIVYTQTDRALQAARRAQIEGGGSYRRIKKEQRALRKEIEEVTDARRELDKVKREAAQEARLKAEADLRAKSVGTRTQRGPDVVTKGQKVRVKKVKKKIRKQQAKTQKALKQDAPLPESQRPKPIQIIDNSLQRSEVPQPRSFPNEAARQKHLASPQATFRELSESITEDMAELARIDSALRRGRVAAEKVRGVEVRQAKVLKRVAARQQRLQKMRQVPEVHKSQVAATTEKMVKRARKPYKQRRAELEEWLAEWKDDLDRFEDLRKKGKLKNADEIIGAHYLQRDKVLAEFNKGLDDAVPKRAKTLTGPEGGKKSAVERGKVSKEKESIEQSYDTLFKQEGDDLFGSQKPATREVENALTREQRIKRIERSKDEGAYGVPGQDTIWWHPDNAAVNSDYANMLRATLEDTSLPYNQRMAAFIQLQTYAKRTNNPLVAEGHLNGTIGAYDRQLSGATDNIQRQTHARHQLAIGEAITRSRRTKKAPTSSRLVLDENGDLVPYVQKNADRVPERGSLDEVYDDVAEIGNLGDDLEPFIGKNEIYDFYSTMKPWDATHPMATTNPMLHRLQVRIGKPEWRRKVNGKRLSDMIDRSRAAYADAQAGRLQRQIDEMVGKLEDLDKQINELLDLRKGLTRQDLKEMRRVDGRIKALRTQQAELIKTIDPKLQAAQARLTKVKAGEIDAAQGGIKEYKDAIQPFYDLFHQLSRDGEVAQRQLRNAHDQMVNRAFEVLPDGSVKVHWEEEAALTWLLMESRWGHEFALAPDVIEGVMWEFFSRRGMLPGHAMMMFNPTYTARATARFTQMKPRFDSLMTSSRQYLANRLPSWTPVGAGLNIMTNAYHRFNAVSLRALKANKKLPFEKLTRTASALLDGQVEHWQNWIPQKGQMGRDAARSTGVNGMRAVVLDNGIHGWVSRTFTSKNGKLVPKNDAAKVEIRAIYDRYIDLRKKSIRRAEPNRSEESILEEVGQETEAVFLDRLNNNYRAIRLQGGLGKSRRVEVYKGNSRNFFSSYGQTPPDVGPGIGFEFRTAFEFAWGAGEVGSHTPLEEVMMFMARSQFWDDVNIGMSQRFMDRMTAWGYGDEVRDFLREWHAPEFYGMRAELARYGDQNIALQNILANDKLQTPLGKLFLQVEGEDIVRNLKTAGRESEARRLADELGEGSRAAEQRAAMLEQEDLFQRGRPDYSNPQELADTLADVQLKMTKGTRSEQSTALRTLREMLVELDPGATGWVDVRKLLDELKADPSLSERMREMLVKEFDPRTPIRNTPVAETQQRVVDTPSAETAARGLTQPETVKATGPEQPAPRPAPDQPDEFEEVTEYTVETVETTRTTPGPEVQVQYTIEPDPRVLEEVTTKAFANIMDMSEEDFLAALAKKNNDLLRSKRVSIDDKIAIRVQNKQIRAVQKNIAKQKANGMYTTPRRAFSVAHRAAYKLRKRMEGIIPPRQIAYYAETADQADIETARAINNKLQNVYVKAGEGIDPRIANDIDIADYELLDMLVSREVRAVQQRRTSSIGLRSPEEGDPTLEMLMSKTDGDPKILDAKKKALREYQKRTGKTVDIRTYDRMRTLLAPHMTRRGRTLDLIMEAELASRKNGTTYYEEFIRLRKQKADINARRNVGWTLYENPHLTPDEAADLVSLTWFNDGTIRHAPSEITEFDEIILKKMFSHLTGGADITDEAQRVKALNSHGTTPPMDKRFRFRSHQERQGTWSPRAVETVIERGAWSVDQERKWWLDNYGQMPAWLGDVVDDPATFLTHEGYYRAMKGSGNFDDNIVRDRILSGEERVEYHELAWGRRDKDGNWLIKPQKDLEIERQYAFERYGSRVATQNPATGEIEFHSMPWLMRPDEYKAWARSNPEAIDNLVPPEAVDAVQESIAKITDKHIQLYMNSHWSAGVAEIDPADVHAIAFELVRELASTVPWASKVKNVRNRAVLDAWSSFWRASIISNPAFVLSNLVDTPTKGILFSVTDDMLGTVDPRAKEAIAGLHDIGRGQGSAYLYSRSSRTFMERVSRETTYGRIDQLGAVWDAAAFGLAKHTLQPMEDATKLRLAQEYYTTLRWGNGKPDGPITSLLRGKTPDETVFDALIRNGASEQQADLILKIQVQRKVDRMFPTLESAGLGERMLNKLFPFISYNLKNKVIWVSWALDHPMMVRAFMDFQEALFEHNKNWFMEKYDLEEGDYMPEHLFHQIRIGGDFFLDISNFTDAARGLRPLVDPGGSSGDLNGFIQNFFRPLPSQSAAVSALLWKGFGIGGRVVWDRVFDEDGQWTGEYEKRLAEPLTPWGRSSTDLAQYIWGIEWAQTMQGYVEDGDLSDGEVVKILGDTLLFSGLSEPSENFMLNLKYRQIYDINPDKAADWLQNTEMGQRLVELWDQSFFEGSFSKLDEFTLIGRDENGIIHTVPTPEQIRDVYRKNMLPEERDKLFTGWNELTAIQEGFDMAIDGVTDPVLIDQLWTARRTAIAQVYGKYPMLGFYEGMGKDSEEFSMYTQNFALDQQAHQFFAEFGAAKVPDDPKLADQFYKDREKYLRANPELVEHLYGEADQISKVENGIVEDYKQFFKQDVLTESLTEAFAARDWQSGEDAARAAKEFAGLAFDFQGLAKDEDGRFVLIQKNIIGRLKGGEEGALYSLKVKAAWEQADGDPSKWWDIVDGDDVLKQQYFDRNPDKRATWAQDGKYYRFWGRFSRLADKGKWDAAWDSWDNAPNWVRDRMRDENPRKFRELERSSRYSTFMGTWIGLFEAGKPREAMAYFHSLPKWAKDRYYENHPGKQFGTSSSSSGRGTAYVSNLNTMFGMIDAGDWDGAERYWNNMPAWMRRRYYANNPDSTLFRGGSGGGSGSTGGGISDAKYKQYIGMMQKWVDLQKDGKDAEADKYFRSLPKWAQDFYLARHPDKALLKEDMQMQTLLMDFFGANKAEREAMKANNPKLMKWLQENSTKAARANAIQFLYSKLPDDPWLKRVFREKYPEVFSAEARGQKNIDKVSAILAEHPSFIKAWMKWYKDINETLLEAMKWSQARPKEILPERLTFDPDHGDSLSAEETSSRVDRSVRATQELNKRLPKLDA